MRTLWFVVGANEKEVASVVGRKGRYDAASISPSCPLEN
jgi:hypothetical protein